MSKHVTVELIDDVNGEPADETVLLTLDGVRYEIDLTMEHAERLRDDLKPWTEAAHRTGGRRSAKRGAARGARLEESEPQGPTSGELRIWAHENGLVVSSKGRVPEAVRTAYLDAVAS